MDSLYIISIGDNLWEFWKIPSSNGFLKRIEYEVWGTWKRLEIYRGGFNKKYTGMCCWKTTELNTDQSWNEFNELIYHTASNLIDFYILTFHWLYHRNDSGDTSCFCKRQQEAADPPSQKKHSGRLRRSLRRNHKRKSINQDSNNPDNNVIISLPMGNPEHSQMTNTEQMALASSSPSFCNKVFFLSNNSISSIVPIIIILASQ